VPVAFVVSAQEAVQMVGDQPPQRAEEGLSGAEPRAVGCGVAGAGGQRPGLRRRGWPERVHPARQGRLALPPSACPRRFADLCPSRCQLVAEILPFCEPGRAGPGRASTCADVATRGRAARAQRLLPGGTRPPPSRGRHHRPHRWTPSEDDLPSHLEGPRVVDPLVAPHLVAAGDPRPADHPALPGAVVGVVLCGMAAVVLRTRGARPGT